MKRGKREAKRTGLGRRLLSVFLAVVMCTSMLQLTVFAEGTDAPAGGGTTTTSNVMNGSYVLNGQNEITSTVTGQGHATVTKDGFTLTKTAAPAPARGENEFDVTLQVQTSQTTTTTLPVAAIQLVIDVSVTMDYCGSCNKTSCNQHASRMTELKTVLNGAEGFLNKLAADNVKASKVYVSVVTYGSGAKTVCDWEDIKTDAGLTAVKSAITNLRASDYATNIEAGLMLARNRLDMSKPASADVKYTVLLTDGQANCYVKKDVTSTSSISSSDCSSAAGADGTEDGKNAAAKMAAKVTPKSTLYGVGYGSEKTYLAAIIGNPDNTFAGDDSASIAKAFNFIAQDAVSGITGAGAAVTDPMGDFIKLGDVTELVNAGVITTSADKSSIRWVLADAVESQNGNTTTYTYTLTYPITLDTAAQGFVEDYYYPTNGYTYLTTPDGSKQLAFNVPGVKGQLPMVNWTIKHHLQDAVGGTSYTEVETDRETGSVKAWTEVTATANEYAGYDFSHSDTESLTMTVAPTDDNVINLFYNLETVDVSVIKNWDDANNQDGKRPTEITIKLYANDVETGKTLTLSGSSNSWTGSFSDLPKYANGQEIAYTISEDTVADYNDPAITGSAAAGFTVTNSRTPETITISGEKTWVDNDNAYNTRPDSITIRVWNGATEVANKTITAANDWAWEFTGLAKYAGGQLINYSITEDAVANYNTTYNGYNVTNTLSPDSVNITGTKTWNDNNDQDGIRPTSVTINLMADGEKIDEAVVSEATGWAYAFNNLPRYTNGVAINYSITEDEVAGYTTTYNGYNVTNTHASATVNVAGSKTWDDGDNQDGIRPTSITINLLANGVEIREATVTAANGWAWSFDSLPAYSNGVAIVYTITEDEVAGYTTTYNGYNVINSHSPAVGTLILNKRAVGANVPETAEFTVTGPHNYSKTVTYGEFKEGSYVIADIPVGVYTFTEDVATAQVKDYTLTAVGNGGSATVTAGAVAHVGITNKYEKIQTTGSLTINKTITGLDTITENTLKNNLSFVVTNEEIGYEKEISYSEGKGAMTLTDLTPGTYTIVEKGADIGGGYDLTVKAYDADNDEPGYQVYVKASKNAASFDITNIYTSRVYNVWFNGGAYGTVKVNDDIVKGVYRNRVFKSEEVAEVKWSAAQLPINVTGHVADHLYQIDNEEVIYQNVGMGPVISGTEGYGYVMYTFTWADYVNYKNYKAGYVPYTADMNQAVVAYDLAISAPALAVQDGWETNGTFYRNGTQVPFTGIDAAVEYMNSGAVEADNDGVYNVLYVPAYSEEVVPYGNLTINKTATGADVPAGATFTVTDAAGNTVEAKYVDFKDGSYTFKDLPVGTYTVTETNAGVKGYSLKVGGNNQTVAVVADATAVVSITNTYTFNGGGGGGGGGGFIIPENPIPLNPAPQPAPEVVIPDEDVPLVDIPEEDVPMADVPKTGDASALWLALSVLSGTGLAGVNFLGRKKRDEEI